MPIREIFGIFSLLYAIGIGCVQFIDKTSFDLSGNLKYNILQESSALKNIPVVIMSSENVPARISR